MIQPFVERSFGVTFDKREKNFAFFWSQELLRATYLKIIQKWQLLGTWENMALYWNDLPRIIIFSRRFTFGRAPLFQWLRFFVMTFSRRIDPSLTCLHFVIFWHQFLLDSAKRTKCSLYPFLGISRNFRKSKHGNYCVWMHITENFQKQIRKKVQIFFFRKNFHDTPIYPAIFANLQRKIEGLFFPPVYWFLLRKIIKNIKASAYNYIAGSGQSRFWPFPVCLTM